MTTLPRKPRALSEDRIKAEQPRPEEFTLWDPSLPRFGVRVRPNGAKTYIIKFRAADGRQRKFKIGACPALPLAEARKIARGHLAEVEKGRDPAAERTAERSAPTMAVLAAEYMNVKQAVKRPSSLRDDASMWRHIILPELGARRVTAVKYADVERLHRSRAATPVRANRVLALLSTAFGLAVRWGWRPDNPAKGVERFHEEKRETWVQGDDLTRLVAVLADHPNRRAADAFILLLLTGARRSEVFKAEWSQFDLEVGVWCKPSSHTKQKRVHRAPLSAPATALIARLAAEAAARPIQSAFLFPGDSPGKPVSDLKKAWAAICCAAGLSGVRVHDLRHSFASALVSDGVPLLTVGRLLGHTQAATTHRYSHLADDPLREATERMGRLVAGTFAQG